MNPPEPVLDIARRLEREGFEAWCVGGAVRDALLGHPHLDWDLATSATPEQVRAVFGKRRTIPVGIQFGTVGVLDDQGTLHEVTTFRRDVRTDGRHAEVEFGATLDEDLARRDFTINAIAYSPSRDELRDPFGGRADLQRRVVRAVGDANARMREDRLRALRAIRFAARFGFEIDAATLDAVRASAPHMTRLSPERVKQELEKTMEQVERPSNALRLWKSTGVLGTVIPALSDVDDDTLRALDCLPRPANGKAAKSYRLFTRIALLFIKGADTDVRSALTELRFSRAETRRIAELARTWNQVGAAIIDALRASAPPTEFVVRKWVSTIGRLDIAPFMRLVAALLSVSASDDRRETTRVRALYRRMLRVVRQDPIAVADLVVDGDDLRMAGIPPGPWLGKILESLLDAVLVDPTNNRRDWLLQEARRLYDDSKSS